MSEQKSNRSFKNRVAKRGKRSGRSNGISRLKTSSPGEASSSNLMSGFTIKMKPLFGYKLRTKVQYYSSTLVTSGASGAANAQVYSANGLFDPDITGTGGQPMGFDQAMLFYNHYTVHSARIRCVVNSANTALSANASMSVSGSSTVTTVVENLVENGDITFQQLGYAGALGSKAVFTRRLNVGRFQAVDDVMDDPNMRGDSASNPTEQAYFHISTWNNESAATVTCSVQTLIEYDVTFHEPRKGPLS